MLDTDSFLAGALIDDVIHVGIRGNDNDKIVGTIGPDEARSFADLLISLANEVDPGTHYS